MAFLGLEVQVEMKMQRKVWEFARVAALVEKEKNTEVEIVHLNVEALKDLNEEVEVKIEMEKNPVVTERVLVVLKETENIVSTREEIGAVVQLKIKIIEISMTGSRLPGLKWAINTAPF